MAQFFGLSASDVKPHDLSTFHEALKPTGAVTLDFPVQ